QLSLKRAQVRLWRVVLELPCDLGLLGFGSAAPHGVTPSCVVPGRHRSAKGPQALRRPRSGPGNACVLVVLTLHEPSKSCSTGTRGAASAEGGMGGNAVLGNLHPGAPGSA